MIFTFDHKLANSIVMWLDNRICDYGQGYTNQSSILYNMGDLSRSNYNYWNAPYKSWVYDSSVNGAIIPSGFYDTSGNFLTRSSGINIDYVNGRVFSSGYLSPTLSGNYSNKTYNVYYSDLNTINFYLERLYNENTNIQLPTTGSIPYVFNAPCVIITNSYSKNEPYAFGGQKKNDRLFRLYVLSNNNYNQDTLNTIIMDSFNKSIPLIDTPNDIPLNFNNDLKTGYYNYNNIINKYKPPQIYIKDAFSFKISEKLNKNVGYALSLWELDVEVIRISDT